MCENSNFRPMKISSVHKNLESQVTDDSLSKEKLKKAKCVLDFRKKLIYGAG